MDSYCDFLIESPLKVIFALLLIFAILLFFSFMVLEDYHHFIHVSR